MPNSPQSQGESNSNTTKRRHPLFNEFRYKRMYTVFKVPGTNLVLVWAFKHKIKHQNKYSSFMHKIPTVRH